jgi:putative flippase GtrA
VNARLRPSGTLARFGRFNLVGVAGFALQLALLHALTRLTSWPLPVCVAVAVLATVSHNFVWHVHYTWRGTTDRWLARWVAFNLSNGAVSLVTNVIVTTAVAALGVPVLAANVAAVGTAAIVNFFLSDRLVFARGRAAGAGARRANVNPCTGP